MVKICRGGEHTDVGRLNRAAELEFSQVGTALMTLADEMMTVPVNTRDPQYRLLCDDLQENHRRIEEHTTPLMTPSNYLCKQLLLDKIKRMQEQLACNVSFKSGVLPHDRVVKPRDLINSNDSIWGDDISVFTSQDLTSIIHFLGLYTNEPGNPNAIQPDDQGYLVLKNKKLRLKFKKVCDLVGMDTLAALIDKCKLIFNAT